jgi:hypothetical protein
MSREIFANYLVNNEGLRHTVYSCGIKQLVGLTWRGQMQMNEFPV